MELMTAADYHHQLVALLPPGVAWSCDDGSIMSRLLFAQADALARVHLRLVDLIDEFDPRSTYEMLTDWEEALGLPDACSQAAPSIEARQLLCWRKLAYAAGQTPAFYIALAGSLGFEIEIHEFDPAVDTYDATLTSQITGGRWRYVWRVHVLNAGDFSFMRAGDPVGTRLVEGDPALNLECILAAAKPAHTHVIFSYPET